MRVVRQLQRQSRQRMPVRKSVYFDRKGKLGKGFEKKYSTAAIGDIMKKLYSKKRA